MPLQLSPMAHQGSTRKLKDGESMLQDKRLIIHSSGARPTLVILGETGTGKSSLCNRMSGFDASSDKFPVSSGPASCTQSAVIQDVTFDADENKPVKLIDTMGSMTLPKT